MYNMRLKKAARQLEFELHRGSDEQIEELYTIIKNAYNERKALNKKAAEKIKGE